MKTFERKFRCVKILGRPLSIVGFLISVVAQATVPPVSTLVNSGFEMNGGIVGWNSDVPGWGQHNGYPTGTGIWGGNYLNTDPSGKSPTCTGTAALSLVCTNHTPEYMESWIFQSVGVVSQTDVGKQFSLSALAGARNNSICDGLITVAFRTGTSTSTLGTVVGTAGSRYIDQTGTGPVQLAATTQATYTAQANDVGSEIFVVVSLLGQSKVTQTQAQFVVDDVITDAKLGSRPDWPADFNHDYLIDFKDLEVIVESWLDEMANTAEAGLVAYHGFDTDACDRSGYGNHGTVYGGATFVSNQDHDCISFDGADDYLLVPDSNSISIGNQDYTIAAWINPASVSGLRGIIAKLTDAQDKEYAFSVSDAKLRLDVEKGGNNGAAATLTEVVTTGDWQHVAVTFDSSTLAVTFYHNGVAQTTVQNGGAIDTLPTKLDDDLYIGMWGGAYHTYKFSGAIDDVRIYNSVLSPEQVKTLANGLLADLNNDGVVNFKDFAHLADIWGSTVDKYWQDLQHQDLLAPGVGASMVSDFIENDLQDFPLPAIGTEWLANRHALRAKILDIVGLTGLYPPQWDLDLQYKGTIYQTGYRIEKVTYESYPGMTVSALLYMPDGITGKVPGIVSIEGHWYAWGKAIDQLQARNVNLVKRGCVVLAYDYMDCGERNTGTDPFGGQPYGGGNDHFITNFFYTGITPTALEILDGVRALDVLESLPEVDPNRFGFTGESGGSNSTYWVSAIDPRVKLAVPVSSVTTFEYWIRNNRNWDWHQRPYGIRSIAEIGTLLALHAPNALLVIASADGTDDYEFPLAEALRSFNWANHVYSLLDASNVTSFVESTTSHGYQEDKRRTMYLAVEQYLQPPFPAGDTELPVIQQTYEDLTCGLPADNLTFSSIFDQLRACGPNVPETSDERRSRLRTCLSFPDPLPPISTTKTGSEYHSDWSAEFWLVETEPGITIPCKMFGKLDAANKIVLVPGWDSQAIANAYDIGDFVLTFDPRGVGEILKSSNDNWAWFAGHKWPAMQALDIVQVARFCHTQYPAIEVTIDAQSSATIGWAAFFAGACVENVIQAGTVKVSGNLSSAEIPRLPGILSISDIEALWPQVNIVP
ncbi:MAG: LamG-like jellyroll fold domain-containing protein [Planctomycetota bacterium]